MRHEGGFGTGAGAPRGELAARLQRARHFGRHPRADGIRLVVHDFAGHPFTAELARELARRGHPTRYLSFASDPGPKGALTRCGGDPDWLAFERLEIGRRYSKNNLWARRRGDIAYGRVAAAAIAADPPELVISANTPLDSQAQLLAACRAAGARFVLWCQDLQSRGMAAHLGRKLPGLGHAVAAHYGRLERRLMHAADHVVHISEDFVTETRPWGLEDARQSVIRNWGVLHRIPLAQRENGWSRAHGLGLGPRFVYAGTLARKHPVGHLATLAHRMPASAEMIVAASGLGAEALSRARLPRTRFLPLQPIERLPDMLAAADVLLAVLDQSAGRYSVPSKVLSYLCAGRPIVLAAPESNLAARVLREAGAGIVVSPGDAGAFTAAALRFAAAPRAAEEAGARGRAYAERHFNRAVIGDRFETLFARVLASPPVAP